MSGLSIGEKQKILRREFRAFNRENGFAFVRPNTLLRERGDILHYLQFKVKSLYMSCEIVSQPLYIPASGFSMSISTGIQFLGPRTRNPVGRRGPNGGGVCPGCAGYATHHFHRRPAVV